MSVLRTRVGLVCFGVCVAGVWTLCLAGNPWRLYLSDDATPGLPRILLVGDSICNGYRGTVGAKLKGKAVVDVWLTPLHIAHYNGTGRRLQGELVASELSTVLAERKKRAAAEGDVPE